jgi:hypothetical protein
LQVLGQHKQAASHFDYVYQLTCSRIAAMLPPLFFLISIILSARPVE